jgi:betaine reductase
MKIPRRSTLKIDSERREHLPMSKVAIKGHAYCLNHTPELALHYGITPYSERKAKGETEFLTKLPTCAMSYENAVKYPPNQAYVGGLDLDDFEKTPSPWYENPVAEASRFAPYGEIMPEDEFLGLMNICDVFDLFWLEESFGEAVRAKLEQHPLLNEKHLKRFSKGHEAGEIAQEVEKHHALPVYFEGKVVGCCRQGHDVDECLEAYVLLENIACKAGGVLVLLHLLKNASMAPEEVDFVIECSEEAAGDMNQRGGGNFAKAVAEIAGCLNSSGCDVRGFCAGPVNAVIAAASQVAAGARKNCVVLAGGAIPKLYMNARDHVRKDLPALEDCLGNFAVLLTPDDGTSPVMRLDALGKHTVGAGASPQAVTGALVLDPLEKLGLTFTDVDKYAAELQNPEITLPAGAGNVPEANYKMIAALAVMKKQIEKSDMPAFVKQRGYPGFAHTQGHIPSGVPFMGHAVDMLREGKIKRAMIIGKGSLFLARLTNLADGASFIMENSTGAESSSGVTKDDVKRIVLEALEELAANLSGK